ncbi:MULTISPECIES: restriction endonuclease subunit S [Sphingobacterium]|uniref:restriction endonuclease subunit S n=1 Tax=Sphingobacterium TaxID=28453 RepID=UPI0013DA7515|nr:MULTISPECIES: restriction endonuclease subunit S [unclassified Sphingobacterium]
MREDWVECTFEDITSNLKRGPFGGDLKKEMFVESGYKVYEQQHAINNDFSIGRYYINEEHFNNLKACEALSGDYIVSCSGTLGKIARIPQNSPRGIINQALLRIRIEEKLINHNYFINFFKSSHFQQKILSDTRGSGMQNMAGIKEIKPIKLFLPPLPEQRAIVKKIEALFSSLDAGIADLKKALNQLKIYRQAVLKKAFEGELTKVWRENKTDLPTGEELLAQIEEQRQAFYEKRIKDWKEAVAIWEKKGKKPTKPKPLANFQMDTPHIVNNRLNIKIGNVYSVFIGSTPSRGIKEYWENGDVKWISSGEVAFNKIYDTKEKITQKGLLNTSTSLHPEGTIVLAMIGEGKTRGQAAILKSAACHNQNTAAIRMLDNHTVPEYLYYFFVYNYENSRRIGSGNNQKALNQEVINNLVIPFCSCEEQAQIVKEIESRLSVCDAVEQQIKDSLTQAEALRQSILKKAFEGKLLSEAEIRASQQEADYEPASVLLEKIKAEKEANKPSKKTKKK